jgi:hypothetical protein
MREVLRREAIPARPRWWLAAGGMRDWFSFLASRLDAHLGGRAKAALAHAAARMFERRYDALAASGVRLPPRLEDGRALAEVFGGLYRAEAAPKCRWIFDEVGGPPRGVRERARSLALVHLLDPEARWREVTVHLGELLIVLTEELPRELDHARRVLGDVCFEAGVRYARRTKRAWGLSASPADLAALAIEVLRTSEYLFRVNPEHWGGTDASAGTGFLEGTACPWFDRPGWNGAHCGIFGQFQAGVSSEFGLRYILGRTIPKNGGTTCRIDLKPLAPGALVRKPHHAPTA